MTERRRKRRTPLLARHGMPLALLLVLIGCEGEEPGGTAIATGGPSGIRYLSSNEDTDDGFARALAARPFVFPDDHASHPEFRTEWWYFTGNVLDERARHYGFELTLFRVALEPPGAVRESALAASTVWMAHLAVTDTARERFQAAERLSRGARGLAGVTLDGEADEGTAREAPGVTTAGDSVVTVSVEDWSVMLAGDTVELRASDAGFGIELKLTGLSRIVAQGDDGLDAKGPEPGNASFYYSAPRLSVTGELHSAGQGPVAVSGTAWMDREWSTSALSRDLVGWDWFAMQLDDGRDLMFYRLRGADGSTSPFSGGSLTDADGRTRHLAAGDVELTPTREWRSAATGVRYPVSWRMALPGQDLELSLEPRLDDQELDLSVRYWEGAITISGQSAGREIGGVGYLELAGY